MCALLTLLCTLSRMRRRFNGLDVPVVLCMLAHEQLLAAGQHPDVTSALQQLLTAAPGTGPTNAACTNAHKA